MSFVITSHICDELIIIHLKTVLLVTCYIFHVDKSCSLRDLSPSLVEENRVCGSVSGGGV